MENLQAPLAAENLSFEDAMKELTQIVQKLEQGDVPLEESIAIYERGELLKKRCNSLLKAAEEKVLNIQEQTKDEVNIKKDFDEDYYF